MAQGCKDQKAEITNSNIEKTCTVEELSSHTEIPNPQEQRQEPKRFTAAEQQSIALGILPASSRMTTTKIPTLVLRTVSSPVTPAGFSLLHAIQTAAFVRAPYFDASLSMSRPSCPPLCTSDHLSRLSSPSTSAVSDTKRLYSKKMKSKFFAAMSSCSSTTSDSASFSSTSTFGGPSAARVVFTEDHLVNTADYILSARTPYLSDYSSYSSICDSGSSKKLSTELTDSELSDLNKDFSSPATPYSGRGISVDTYNDDTVFLSPSIPKHAATCGLDYCKTRVRKSSKYFSFDPKSPSFLAHACSFGSLPFGFTATQRDQLADARDNRLAFSDIIDEPVEPVPKHCIMDFKQECATEDVPEQKKIFKKQLLERYKAEGSIGKYVPVQSFFESLPKVLVPAFSKQIEQPTPCLSSIGAIEVAASREDDTASRNECYIEKQGFIMASASTDRVFFGEHSPSPVTTSCPPKRLTSSSIVHADSSSNFSPPVASQNISLITSNFLSLQNSPVSHESPTKVFRMPQFLALPTMLEGRSFDRWDPVGQCYFDSTSAPGAKRSRSESDVFFNCPICLQNFHSSSRLSKHMSSKHNRQVSSFPVCYGDPCSCSKDLKDLTVELCFASGRYPDKDGEQLPPFARIDGADALVASSAKGISSVTNKCHRCVVCNKAFSRSDMLSRHNRLHSGIKPYACRSCGQVFSRSDHLSTHQRTHTGEKPYHCPHCSYAASRRDMITRHMKTHLKHRAGFVSSAVDQSLASVNPSSTVIRRIGSNQSVSEASSGLVEPNFLTPNPSDVNSFSDSASVSGTGPTESSLARFPARSITKFERICSVIVKRAKSSSAILVPSQSTTISESSDCGTISTLVEFPSNCDQNTGFGNDTGSRIIGGSSDVPVGYNIAGPSGELNCIVGSIQHIRVKNESDV